MISMVGIIFQQSNISSLKIPLTMTLQTLLQGDKEFFTPSIPKFFCYMLHSPPLLATVDISKSKFARGRILEGRIGLRLLPSLNSSVASGRELSTASTSVINVVRASSFKLVLGNDDKMFLADFICCSHTPPI